MAKGVFLGESVEDDKTKNKPMRIWTFITSYTSCASFLPEPRKAGQGINKPTMEKGVFLGESVEDDKTKNKPMRIWTFITSYTSCASFPPEPRKAGQGINKLRMAKGVFLGESVEDNKDP